MDGVLYIKAFNRSDSALDTLISTTLMLIDIQFYSEWVPNRIHSREDSNVEQLG